jgi:hypothetical protein
MNVSKRCSTLALLLLVAGCGAPTVGTTSAHLDTLERADDPYPGVRGERCNLATQDASESGIRLVAFRDAALVRIDGAPVRLRFRGGDLRRGGSFAGEGVSVEIGGISPAMAEGQPRVGLPALAAVRHGDSVEDFEGTWTCGVTYPAPVAPA